MLRTILATTCYVIISDARPVPEASTVKTNSSFPQWRSRINLTVKEEVVEIVKEKMEEIQLVESSSVKQLSIPFGSEEAFFSNEKVLLLTVLPSTIQPCGSNFTS